MILSLFPDHAEGVVENNMSVPKQLGATDLDGDGKLTVLDIDEIVSRHAR